MINKTHILSSILDIPVKPEPSFQVSHLEQGANERFDHVLQARVDSPKNEAPPAAPQSFEARERPAPEHSEQQALVARDEPTPPVHAENEHSDSRPVAPDSERPHPAPLHEGTHSHSDEPASKALVNPFALPLERLAQELNPTDKPPGLVDNANQAATDVLAELFDSQGLNLDATHGLNEEGSPAIHTLKELLAGLNIDAETINQLIEALNNGDAAGVQGILNVLHGLLHASQQAVQAPVAGIVADVAGNRLNPPEQIALKLLVQAGLTQQEAQQVIQQVRAGNATQPATDNSTQLSKTALDAIASKLNSENSPGSGKLQNGDSSGSARNSSDMKQ